MNTFFKSVKNHLSSNKNILLSYIGGTLLFYILIYIFFHNSPDAPLDIIFAAVYILFIPGLITGLTFYREDIELTSGNKEYFEKILLNIFFPIVISIVYSFLYELIKLPQGSYQGLIMVNLFALPAAFLAVIILLEIKSFTGFELGKKISIVVVIVSYIVLTYVVQDITSSLKSSYPSLVLNLVYLYLLPVIMISSYYRRQLLYWKWEANYGDLHF